MEQNSPPATLQSSSPESLSQNIAVDGSPSSEFGSAPTDDRSLQSLSSANRTADGKFLPGKSGNPAGLPKGTKQKNRELKDRIELALRQEFRVSDLKRVWRAVVENAVGGSVGAQKLVLEYTMSKVSDVMKEEEDKGPREYVFYVVDSRAAGETDEKPIEGEFHSTQE